MKALGAICGAAWAIQEAWLEALCAIAAREDPDVIASLEALQGRPGVRTDWRGIATDREGGVRIIEVAGPIFRRADFFTSISGATDTGTLAKKFGQAVDDPEVKSILLEIDSPGGEAAGIGEFAGMIHAARGVKPVVAYVSDLGCSGAYWLASAADRVVAAPTSSLGSIGVVMVHTDTREAERRRGITRQQFVSSQSPNKRPDLDTDAGRAQVQKVVDDIASVFVRDVARYRGVSEDHVVGEFGAGGVLIGENAVGAGLADELGTLEALVSELAAPERHITGGGAWPIRSALTSGGPRSAAKETGPMAEEQTQQSEGFWKRAFHALAGGEQAAPVLLTGEPGRLAAVGGSESGDLREARAERDAAVKRADAAEGELDAVCAHFADRHAKAAVRAGTKLGALEERTVASATKERDWKFLAGIAEEQEAKAVASLPAGTSADTKAATAGDEKPNPVIEAAVKQAKAKAEAAGNGRAR